MTAFSTMVAYYYDELFTLFTRSVIMHFLFFVYEKKETWMLLSQHGACPNYRCMCVVYIKVTSGK